MPAGRGGGTRASPAGTCGESTDRSTSELSATRCNILHSAINYVHERGNYHKMNTPVGRTQEMNTIRPRYYKAHHAVCNRINPLSSRERPTPGCWARCRAAHFCTLPLLRRARGARRGRSSACNSSHTCTSQGSASRYFIWPCARRPIHKFIEFSIA